MSAKKDSPRTYQWTVAHTNKNILSLFSHCLTDSTRTVHTSHFHQLTLCRCGSPHSFLQAACSHRFSVRMSQSELKNTAGSKRARESAAATALPSQASAASSSTAVADDRSVRQRAETGSSASAAAASSAASSPSAA